MFTVEQFKDLWPFIMFVGSALVWLFKLQFNQNRMKEDLEKQEKIFIAKIIELERDQSKLEKDIWKKLNEMNNEISQLGKTLSRIEGKLEITIDSKH